MKITSLSYCQYRGLPQEWGFENFQLGQTNLIVGKNAHGKTRLLNVIGNFANLVCGEKKDLSWGAFDVFFDNAGKKIYYSVEIENYRVVSEILIIDDKKLLDRLEGKIFAQRLGTLIDFQAPDKDLACVTRRDQLQHPFFEDLFQWGKSVRHYYFGTPLGQNTFIFLDEIPSEKKNSSKAINLKNTTEVVSILRDGIEKFSQNFKSKIIEDMKKLEYEIENIDIESFTISLNDTMTKIKGLVVKEKDMSFNVPQFEISQGMFRALSLIIQINYSALTSSTDCILIDDIGEGLDYQRSTALVKLLIEKISSSNVQLIMTTNDRFIMNNVPLEFWCVIQRGKQGPNILTYQNSKEIFEKFELTGLNNFDFFSSQYFDSKDH